MKIASTLVSFTILVLFAGMLFAGCGPRARTVGRANWDFESMGPTGPVDYPIETDVTVTWWVDISHNVRSNFTNLGETPWGMALMEKTGINIRFIHPPAGTGNEQFNLMVASGNLPDIIERNWGIYPGGPARAISDGIILPLNDFYSKFSPFLESFLRENPDFDRMVRLDDGTYVVYPFIRGHPGLLGGNGLMIRQDWLDELGLEMPATIDEWHTVLTAFRDGMGSPAPLSFEFGAYMGWLGFVSAFDVMRGFYVASNGSVRYGQIEDGYREFLKTFSRWYREGLIDPDLFSLQQLQVAAKVTSGTTGATIGALGSRMGSWIPSGRSTNPNFNLVAAPIPTIERGDVPYYVPGMSGAGFTGAAVTTAARHPDVAARLLDFGYGPQGQTLHNFGIEGTSFEWVDGIPVFTDEVLQSPRGWPPAQALAAFVRSHEAGPFVQDIRYFEQYMSLPEQRDAIRVWFSERTGMNSLPPITPTQDETSRFARIMNEINTYVAEMEIRFIIGTESMDNWDGFVNTVRRMGINEALAVQNAALARFYAR